MADYDDLKNHQQALIRKALKGSLFIGGADDDPIVNLTTYHAAVTGPPAVPAYIDLTALPTGWDDLGLLSADGASVSEEVSKSEVTSWGYTTPTRSDVVTDTTTLSVVAQETKLLTLGIYTGQDMTTVVPATNTGEVQIDKPARPNDPFYQGLLLAVDDENESGEIFVARYFPKIKRSSKNEQKFGGGDEPISYGMTFQTYVDDEQGFSERWLFGGTGWHALLSDMGFA